MRITAISLQTKNKHRVNISIDGVYRCSLDVFQVSELGLKVGQECTDDELQAIEQESQFGKLYTRAVEYCLARPHSEKEARDYLQRKTMSRMVMRSTGELICQPGVSAELAQRVFTRLQEKGYLDDEKFARWWVETRKLRSGVSCRTLTNELCAKGVARELIELALNDSSRHDVDELAKMIVKKQRRYPDKQKFIAYLLRQGFKYDDIIKILEEAAGYTE